jgi:CRP-like cAMP-binding protein
LLTEGEENEYMYIIRSGQFQGVKNILTGAPADERKNLQHFLSGKNVQNNVRGIIKSDIHSKRSQLTQADFKTKKEIVLLLGKGQVFGEERFLVAK